MPQLIRISLLLALASLIMGVAAGCGQKSDDGPVPPPGGKRMSLDDAEKMRPKKKGSDN